MSNRDLTSTLFSPATVAQQTVGNLWSSSTVVARENSTHILVDDVCANVPGAASALQWGRLGGPTGREPNTGLATLHWSQCSWSRWYRYQVIVMVTLPTTFTDR